MPRNVRRLVSTPCRPVPIMARFTRFDGADRPNICAGRKVKAVPPTRDVLRNSRRVGQRGALRGVESFLRIVEMAWSVETLSCRWHDSAVQQVHRLTTDSLEFFRSASAWSAERA